MSSVFVRCCRRLIRVSALSIIVTIFMWPVCAGEPRPAERDTTVANSIGQRLVFIEAGEYFRGSLPAEVGRFTDFELGVPARKGGADRVEQRHQVRLTRGYWIGQTEVTRGQFEQFVRETQYQTDAERAGEVTVWTGKGFEQRQERNWRDPGFAQTEIHPVVCVSRNDAIAFCKWLSKKEDKVYRLPTEAEWEYACRAGTTSAYAWGERASDGKGWANVADRGSWSEYPSPNELFPWNDDVKYTAATARYRANAWGLHDMHGNVQEWCLDILAPYPDGDVVDPTGPDIRGHPNMASTVYYVLRGGSFYGTPDICRSAMRGAGLADGRNVDIGFRLVMESEE